MRLLLVEDDPELAAILMEGFREHGVDVARAATFASGRMLGASGDYDLLILDVMLPGGSGFDLCRRLRDQGVETPILMLTAKDALDDRVAGLDAGADDYLLKPIELAELQARLRALLRRAAGAATPLLQHKNLSLDPASKQVTLSGQVVALSGREYALLYDLLSHKNHIRSRQELESGLYTWGEEVGSNTVEVYIHHLRKKLGADQIRTIRGLGYVLGEAP